MRVSSVGAAVAALALLAGPTEGAQWAEDPLRRPVAALAAARVADQAGAATHDTAQAQYDAARDLEVALPAPHAVGERCRRLVRDLHAYARGLVREAEGFDRLDARLAAAGARQAAAARRRFEGRALRCPAGAPPRRPAAPALREPRDGAAFFGTVVDARACGERAVVAANGRDVGRLPRTSSSVRVRLRLPPGSYDVGVRHLRGERVCRHAVARRAYLLPAAVERGRPPAAPDARLARRLATVGASFGAYAGLYVHQVRTGRTAGWNDRARFPAASTVKLGLLVAVLRRFGPGRRVRYDLEAMAGWSSNLAANRLLGALGEGSDARGARRVEAALRRMGANASTYPGGYRVGTAVAVQQQEPPLVSGRVTTARDLGRVLWLVHAAAIGRTDGRRATGLGRDRARLALGMLLRWERRGPNSGLVAPWLPRGRPVAQKSGWIRDARHTAALVYGADGPTIVVVLAYRPGISGATARGLGRQAAVAAGITPSD